MKYHGKKFLFLIFMFHSLSGLSAYGQDHCRIPSKGSRLAMDQRDELRLACLRRKKLQVNVSQCLKIASSMEYSTNAEDARLLCLYELKMTPTLKECFLITKQMEYPDSGDEARWECLRQNNKTITPKQCKRIADSMSYPANAQRAGVYCSQELE